MSPFEIARLKKKTICLKHHIY